MKADILTAVLESDSDLVDSMDEGEKTPLAFAASIAYANQICKFYTCFLH